MFLSLMAVGLISFTSHDTDSCLQLDCKDAARFSEEALGTLSRLSQNLYRMRELSIESANGAIGNRERGFFDDEFEAWLEETLAIIERQRFTDSFQDQHYYLRDGFHFETPIRIEQGNFTYLQDFKIEPLDTRSFGALAKSTLKLRRPTDLSSEFGYSLKINDEPVVPSPHDDALSPGVGRLLSAITLASAINSKTGLTGVSADVQETVFSLTDIDADLLAELNSSSAGELQINGVSILRQLNDVNQLAETINDFSDSTGVMARLVEEGLEIYATDGRNIVVEVSSDFRQALGLTTNKAVYTGSLELASRKPFSVKLESGYSVLEELRPDLTLIFPVLSSSGLASTDISTQLGAMNTLAVVDASISQLNDRMVQARMPGMFCEAR